MKKPLILLVVILLALSFLGIGVRGKASVIWSFEYEANGGQAALKILPAWGNLLVVSDSADGVKHPWIMLVNSTDGSVIWSLNLSSSEERILSNGLILGDFAYLVGYNNDTNSVPNLWIVVLDSSGNVVLQRSYGLPDLLEVGTSIAYDGENFYVSGAAEVSQNVYRAAIWELDGSLNLENMGMPGVPGLSSLASSLSLADDGIILGGVSVVQATETEMFTDSFVALVDYSDLTTIHWVDSFDLSDHDLTLRTVLGPTDLYLLVHSKNDTGEDFGVIYSIDPSSGSVVSYLKVDAEGKDLIADAFVYGNILYIVGQSEQDTLVARLDLGLNVTWMDRFDLGGNDSGSSLFVQYTSRIYVVGEETSTDPDGDLYLALISDSMVYELV